MPAISANCSAYNSDIVFRGKLPSYQKFTCGAIQSVENYILPCYLYHKKPAKVDSCTFFGWAKEFIKETAKLRTGNQNIFLIYDGYFCHIKAAVVRFFKDNGIVTIAIPSHLSHKLRTLDVSAFRLFKSHLQQYFD